MNENNKPSNVLSDHALERVMRDVLSGIWEISPDRAQREISRGEHPRKTPADQPEDGR